MNIFKEIPPTAGWPIYTKDLLSLFKSGDSKSSLEDDFKNYLNVGYARITNSGTAAFYIILEVLKDISGKKRVIIPSYICPLVPLAIKRAGLNIVVCDINGRNFDFNKAELEKICSASDDILAVVPAHIGGIPVDLEIIEKIARKYGIFIIEDCAQSLGALYKGKPTGTIGDFSFFSLCRGKGPTIYEGGVIVTTKKEYHRLLDNKIKELARNNFLSEGLKILELFGYWIFYRPHLFWFVYKVPQIFWNMQAKPLKAVSEYYEINFDVHKVSKIRKSIGHLSLRHLENQIQNQRQKAAYYIEGLRGIKGVTTVTESQDCKATYPYLTLVFDEPQKQKKAKAVLGNSGLGISNVYTLAITDYEYLKGIVPAKENKGARFLAERQITLSTSIFMTNKDLDYILNTIENL